MSSSFLFGLSITLLVLILAIESVYNPYLYDDGHGGEEHCCIVRVREDFCLATPITRSLIQVNKQCARFPKSKDRRFRRRNRNKAHLDKITRRLNVQKIQEDDDKILIELQKPLEKNILQRDLICLTSINNSINLDLCYVELDDDSDNDRVPHREHRRRKYRDDDQNVGQIKRPILKSDEQESAMDHDENEEDNEAENEIRRIEISHPIRIREGRGLSFLKQYQIDPNHIRPKTRQQRLCWSWYRDQTRKIRRNPSKSFKSCVHLNDAREHCINQLIYNTFNYTEEEEQQIKRSFSIGSKLFCKTHDDQNKLLGRYRNAEICFDRDNQINIEYKFSDIARLSNQYKNKDTLEFIANDEKLTAEFEDDCHEKTNLVEETEPETTTTSIQN